MNHHEQAHQLSTQSAPEVLAALSAMSPENRRPVQDRLIRYLVYQWGDLDAANQAAEHLEFPVFLRVSHQCPTMADLEACLAAQISPEMIPVTEDRQVAHALAVAIGVHLAHRNREGYDPDEITALMLDAARAAYQEVTR